MQVIFDVLCSGNVCYNSRYTTETSQFISNCSIFSNKFSDFLLSYIIMINVRYFYAPFITLFIYVSLLFCVTKMVKSYMDEPDSETQNWNSVGLLPTKTAPNNNRQGQREGHQRRAKRESSLTQS